MINSQSTFIKNRDSSRIETERGDGSTAETSFMPLNSSQSNESTLNNSIGNKSAR